MILLRKLEDGSLTEAAAGHGGTDELAVRFLRQAVVRIHSIVSSAEGVQHLLFSALGVERKDRTAIARTTSRGRRAIQRTGCAEYQRARTRTPVAAAFEAIENAFAKTVSLFDELEDRTETVCTTVVRSSVEIAGRIGNQAAIRRTGIGRSFERIQRRQLRLCAPRGNDTKNRPVPQSATGLGNTVQIARRVPQ